MKVSRRSVGGGGSRAPGEPPAPGRPRRSAGRSLRLAPPLVAAAVVVAMAVPRLGRRPLWLDEAYTLGATSDLAATWRGTGGTMGLYYLLVWPVAQLSTDRVWLRLPSLVFAAAAVVVVHEAGRLIGGRRTAALAAATMAVTWSLSRFAIEARSYALALLLVSLSWLGLVGAVGAGSEADRRRWWRLFVAATLLAPLAHGLAAAHFGAQVAALLLAPDRRRWLRACAPVAAALAAEGVALFALGVGEVADWIDPLQWRQVKSFLHVLVGREQGLWVVGALALAGIALAVAGARRRARRDAWPHLVPVFWAAGAPLLVIALSVFRPYAEARYVLGALPGVALLVGAALSRIRPPALVAGAWLVVAAVSLPHHARVTTVGVEDWPALADHVADRAEDGDRVLATGKIRAPLDYAWATGGDRPDVESLYPTDPLGEVRRFYDTAPGTMRSRLLADTTHTVWYVDRHRTRRDTVDALVTEPEITRRYAVTGPWIFEGDLYLVRFEPRR